jgi:pimeloyl-ACP methyl ester carboxylesterase
MARHVIYIPGIGDHHAYGQNVAIQLWRLFGLKPHYMPLGWNKTEGFSIKQKRLLDLVEKLHSDNDSVSLVGVSAGASAALNAYARSAVISRVICICGKINNPETISNQTFVANPDFGESMYSLAASLALLDKKTNHIMSIHPWRDQIVPIPDTLIKNAQEKTLPGWSHATGIFFGVIFGSFSISKLIHSKN